MAKSRGGGGVGGAARGTGTLFVGGALGPSGIASGRAGRGRQRVRPVGGANRARRLTGGRRRARRR